METKGITCHTKMIDFFRHSLKSESAGIIAIYLLGLTIILLQLRRLLL